MCTLSNVNSKIYSTSHLVKTLLQEDEDDTMFFFPEPFVNSFEAGERSSLELIKDFLKNYNYYDFTELPPELFNYLHDVEVRQAIHQTEKEYKKELGINNTLSVAIRKYIWSFNIPEMVWRNGICYNTKNTISTVYILYQISLNLPINLNGIKIEWIIPISDFFIKNDSLNSYKSIENFQIYRNLEFWSFRHQAKKILKYLIDESGINDIQYDLLLLTSEEIKNKDINLYKDFVYLSAQFGRLELLKYFHEAGLPMTAKVAVLSAKNGHLDCLKYFTENYEQTRENMLLFSTSHKAYPSVCIEIISNTTIENLDIYFECLKYAIENAYTLTLNVFSYLPYYHEFLDIFVYLFEKIETKTFNNLNDQSVKKIMEDLCKYNYIKSLKYLVNKGYTITQDHIISSAEYSYDTLKFCTDIYEGPRDKINHKFASICIEATKKNEYAILELMLNYGKKYHFKKWNLANQYIIYSYRKAKVRTFKVLLNHFKYWNDNFYSKLIKKNKFYHFKYAVSQGYPLQDSDIQAIMGNRDPLKYLYCLMFCVISLNSKYYEYAKDLPDVIAYLESLNLSK